MRPTRILLGAAALALAAGTAVAKDRVRIVDSQAMVFAHFGIYHAQSEGFFAAENLDVSVIIGRGGAMRCRPSSPAARTWSCSRGS